MRETILAALVALLLLYVLSRTQWGANTFFSIKGSIPSSGPGTQQATTS